MFAKKTVRRDVGCTLVAHSPCNPSVQCWCVAEGGLGLRKKQCFLQTLLSALPSNIELRGGKGTANQRAPNIAKHCFFRKHRYRHKIKSRAAPFRSIPLPCSSFRIPCVHYMQYTRMTSALHALYSRRRHCQCTDKWTKKGTRTDKWKKNKRQTQSQHTVNTQSTYSQHTVNIQSTHSQQAASKAVSRDTLEGNSKKSSVRGFPPTLYK